VFCSLFLLESVAVQNSGLVSYLVYSEVRRPLALVALPSKIGPGPNGRTLPRGNGTMCTGMTQSPANCNGNDDGNVQTHNGFRWLSNGCSLAI
jgi:hypothetical protein